MRPNTVMVELSAPGDRWEADAVTALTDLMMKHEILRLHLPYGQTSFQIKEFSIDFLNGLLTDLLRIDFHIECPVLGKS